MNYQELYDSYKKLFIKDGELTDLGSLCAVGLVLDLAYSFIEYMLIHKEVI